MAKNKETSALDMTAADAAPAEQKVRIKLPLTRYETDDVYVGLNGTGYLIKRGEFVEVPEGVAEILQRKEENLMRALEYEQKAAKPLETLEQE